MTRAAPCADSVRSIPGGGTDAAQITTPGPVERSYARPLYVAPGGGAQQDAGAAARVVECRTWGDGSAATRVPYAEGATTKRPEQTLAEEGVSSVPRIGLTVAVTTDDRVLYVLDVDGAVSYAGTSTDVEAWPREITPLGCI